MINGVLLQLLAVSVAKISSQRTMSYFAVASPHVEIQRM
jgi:hypothetical protein